MSATDHIYDIITSGLKYTFVRKNIKFKIYDWSQWAQIIKTPSAVWHSVKSGADEKSQDPFFPRKRLLRDSVSQKPPGEIV